jgi:hypothetical protein
MKAPLDGLTKDINELWMRTMAGKGKRADWPTYRRARAALWRSWGLTWRAVRSPFPRPVTGRRRVFRLAAAPPATPGEE